MLAIEFPVAAEANQAPKGDNNEAVFTRRIPHQLPGIPYLVWSELRLVGGEGWAVS
jgi:hypothetical protein